MKKNILIFTLLMIGLQSCYYDNAEELYPNIETNCNIENLSFSTTVTEILSSRCYGCHNNANANTYGEGIKLEDYTDVKNAVDGGRLLGSIKQEPGFAAMPIGAAKLDDCKISQIEAWINAGAPNN